MYLAPRVSCAPQLAAPPPRPPDCHLVFLVTVLVSILLGEVDTVGPVLCSAAVPTGSATALKIPFFVNKDSLDIHSKHSHRVKYSKLKQPQAIISLSKTLF